MIRIACADIEKAPGQSRKDAENASVRHCLEHLGIEDTLSHAPSGAPFLTHSPSVPVSVSHSRTMAVVGVNDENRSFGVDVEETGREQLEKVAPRVLNVDELAVASTMPLGYARAWTAKEAVFKAAGRENVDFKNDILLSRDFSTARFLPSDSVFDLNFKVLNDCNLLCVASQGNNIEIIAL